MSQSYILFHWDGTNENGRLNMKEKQDCEIKAFERMAKRIKSNYQKYKFIITADALYCTASMMNICKNYKWQYILNLNDRLRTVFKDFLDYIEYFNDTNIENYYLDKNYKYKGHKSHMIKFNEEKK